MYTDINTYVVTYLLKGNYRLYTAYYTAAPPVALVAFISKPPRPL